MAGPVWEDHGLVSPSPPAGRSNARRTGMPGRPSCARPGVRDVRLHDGRHTAAPLLLSEHDHPRVVTELLGHSQMRTTMDIYCHVVPALARGGRPDGRPAAAR